MGNLPIPVGIMKRPKMKNLPKGVVALGLVSLFMDMSSEMIHALLPLYLTGTLGRRRWWSA